MTTPRRLDGRSAGRSPPPLGALASSAGRNGRAGARGRYESKEFGTYLAHSRGVAGQNVNSGEWRVETMAERADR